MAASVRQLPASGDPDIWLRLQGRLNDLLLNLATPDTISVVGLLMTAATVFILLALFDLAPPSPAGEADPRSR